jgi:hypothetical protein
VLNNLHKKENVHVVSDFLRIKMKQNILKTSVHKEKVLIFKKKTFLTIPMVRKHYFLKHFSIIQRTIAVYWVASEWFYVYIKFNTTAVYSASNGH